MTKRNLLVNNDELQTERIAEIVELVKIIHPKPKSIQAKPISQSGIITFVVSDKPVKSLEKKDYDFQTTSKNFKASYFEVWVKHEKNDYFLSKAYFHLYRTDNEYLKSIREDGEYVLLHCDPNDNDEHGDYKRSPHVHIENAEYPINKAHIALNLSNITQILESRLELNKALKSAILMLKEQIIDMT